MPLAFQRYYASYLRRSFIAGDLGSNWRHNFDARLYWVGNAITYVTHDGRVTEFLQNVTSGAWNQTTNTDTPYQLSTAAGQDATLYDPADERVYTFDFTTSSVIIGKLVGIEDGHGNRHTVTYDLTTGQLQSVSDGLGRMLTFTYNSDLVPKISAVSDGTRNISFEYTDPNDTEALTRATDGLSGVTVYTYQDTSTIADHALMLSMARPRGNVPYTQTFFDTTAQMVSGRVATQTDADGNRFSFAYNGMSTTLTDPLGNTRVDTHTASGEFSNRMDQAGNSFTMGSDATGRRNSITDRLGDTTTYDYHAPSGKLAAVTTPEGTGSGFSYTARLFGELTLYDLAGITHADGTTESFAYNSLGRMTSHTDQLGNTATATYDANDRPLTETNRAGGTITNTFDAAARLSTATSPAGDTTTFTYDGLGRPSTITLPGGATRSFTYDAQNHPLTATDENGNTVTFSYDANGNLASVQNPLLQTLTIAYDGNDRPLSVTDPLGNTTSRTFDALGRVGTETDANTNTTTFGYNTRSRLTRVAAPGAAPGGQAQTFTYDDEGILASRTTPLGHTTTFLANSMGRLTRTTTPTGREYRLTYDAMGRAASRVGPLGNTTTLSRDARGLLTGVALPGGVSTTYKRNTLGNITGITDPNGSEWTSTFDDGGRRTADIDPLGNTTAFTYDSRARTSEVTYPGALGTLSVGYDPAGNLTSASWSDGTTHDFTYDGANRLITATGVSLDYDAAGRVTSSNGIELTHDAGSRVTAMTLAPGKTVTYAYDANDRVTSVTDWAGGSTTLTWDDDNRLTAMTRPNGVNATFTYDADGYLLGISEGTLSDIALVRDSRGNVTSATRTVPTAASATAVEDATYAYDAASRLTGATHDALGRMTANGADTYEWDLASHLTSYTRGGAAATATYDAAGQRLSLSRGGTTRSYVWNAGLASPSISVEKEGGADLNYYVHLPDGRLLYRLAAADDTRSFYHFDEMGNTLYLTDNGGAVVASYAYSPFGRLLDATGTLDNPFTWQGQHGAMAEGNDLYYLRTRYYDGALGRFLSRDGALSITPLGINPYQYANANPQRYVDRTGLTPEDAAAAKEARYRKEAQTVYILAKGQSGGKMAFVQFLLGRNMRDILREQPLEMKRLSLDLDDFAPPSDDIESVLPELAPIIVDYAGNAIVADNAYLPRLGQKTKNVETSARETIVAKGVRPEFRFSDPFSDLFGKNGMDLFSGPEPVPSTSGTPRRVSQGVPEFQLEQMFRALFDWLAPSPESNWWLYKLFTPTRPTADPDSIIPELTPITVIA